MDRAEALLATPLFRDLARSEIEELVPQFAERSFARGETVWLEGDRADVLYVVVSGQLKSYRLSREGTEVILLFNGSGEVAGEVGLFHPTRRRLVSMTAMAPSRCLTLSRPVLLAFMAGHPVVMERMLARLSEVAGHAAYAFSGVAFEDIRSRVARALLTLADEFGVAEGPDVRIRLKLSQATLAALVAASRENVNRALSGYLSAGGVSQRDGYFIIHDRTVLEAGITEIS